jgi:hypothetical protein
MAYKFQEKAFNKFCAVSDVGDNFKITTNISAEELRLFETDFIFFVIKSYLR